MVERRKRPTSASQYCVRGTDSLLYQREHSATRWDGALELGVNYMGKPTTVPFTDCPTVSVRTGCCRGVVGDEGTQRSRIRRRMVSGFRIKVAVAVGYLSFQTACKKLFVVKRSMFLQFTDCSLPPPSSSRRM